MNRVGRYEIEEELGRGKTGVVYRARDRLSGRPVALKALSPGGEPGQGVSPAARLRREAALLERVRHPGIVRFLGLYEGPEGPCILTELVEGETLAEILHRRGRLELPEAISVVVQTARALAAAHRQGVIHRDVKPANLLIARDGSVKLTDFGVACLEGEASLDPSQEYFRGTPAYVSPEQWRGGPLDGRADLFALGVVFYRLLTGRRPFEGAGVRELVHRTLRDTPAAPSRLVSGLPPEVEQICLALLERSPRDRPASGDRLAESLERVVLEPVDPAAAAEAARGRLRIDGGDDPWERTWRRLPVQRRGASALRRGLLVVAGVLLMALAARWSLSPAETPRAPRAGANTTPAGVEGAAPAVESAAAQRAVPPGGAAPRLPAWGGATPLRPDLLRRYARSESPSRVEPAPPRVRRPAPEPSALHGAPVEAAFPPRAPAVETLGDARSGPPSHGSADPVPVADAGEPEGVGQPEVPPPPPARGRGVVSLRHGLDEGLVELRIDGRRAGLVRIGPRGGFSAAEPVLLSFSVPPGRHQMRLIVLSASRSVELESEWEQEWSPGEFLSRQYRLEQRARRWRLAAD